MFLVVWVRQNSGGWYMIKSLKNTLTCLDGTHWGPGRDGIPTSFPVLDTFYGITKLSKIRKMRIN